MFKKMISPKSNAEGSKNNVSHEDSHEIKPFQTNFYFIEEFEFKIVDFFKDNMEIKDIFNFICKKSEKFRTKQLLT